MWYCWHRKPPRTPQSPLVWGRWYEGIREHGSEIVVLSVDGGEVEVIQRSLIWRETKAEYSYAYRYEQMQDGEQVAGPTFVKSWVLVCPEGHREQLTTGGLRPQEHECPECRKPYRVQDDD